MFTKLILKYLTKNLSVKAGTFLQRIDQRQGAIVKVTYNLWTVEYKNKIIFTICQRELDEHKAHHYHITNHMLNHVQKENRNEG